MSKFMTVRESEPQNYVRRLNALADEGWHMVSSGYTSGGYQHSANSWWAVLRKGDSNG